MAATSGNLAAGAASVAMTDVATNAGQRAISRKAEIYIHIGGFITGASATAVQESNESKLSEDKKELEEKH